MINKTWSARYFGSIHEVEDHLCEMQVRGWRVYAIHFRPNQGLANPEWYVITYQKDCGPEKDPE